MTSRKDYEAAKGRVERFRGSVHGVWDIWGGTEFIRADLNLIAEYEGDSIERAMEGPPKGTVRTHLAPAISPRLYMVGCALTGLLADGSRTSAPGDAVRYADQALKEMGE